ncbi:hypothetical protein B9Z19DRAFT_673061 [Tuber borchii]|uniref:Uncharacterized protein n=1 Tax=Tuber borchii TaxID=42251 RepID=A0A2T6ZZQ0_TUBBO|nr:hypothetical protein B9Z19DRAFT_673061 [Tuber borchii]
MNLSTFAITAPSLLEYRAHTVHTTAELTLWYHQATGIIHPIHPPIEIRGEKNTCFEPFITVPVPVLVFLLSIFAPPSALSVSNGECVGVLKVVKLWIMPFFFFLSLEFHKERYGMQRVDGCQGWLVIADGGRVFIGGALAREPFGVIEFKVLGAWCGWVFIGYARSWLTSSSGCSFLFFFFHFFIFSFSLFFFGGWEGGLFVACWSI